jgi:aryl-alcohol dehydrogenase-like predicted oxidoreductase
LPEKKDPGMDRREFLRRGTVGALGIGIVGGNLAVPSEGKPVDAGTPMPERDLGRTGHRVRLFSLGGQATVEEENRTDDAVAIIHRAIDLGVNYCDTAPYYGPSQDYFGEVMKDRRKEVFLATKTHDRTRDGSLKLLEQSLKRLNTDQIDLWQLHNVRSESDLEEIFAEDGAIHALRQAREEKMVRFLGITGHKDPEILIRGIERFDFDCILMALNAADRHHLPFIERLLPLAVKKQMGIIGMKVPARGRLFREEGLQTMKEAVDYVWTLPVSTIIVGCDSIQQLEENIRLAKEFQPLGPEEMSRLERQTASIAREASFFKYWS